MKRQPRHAPVAMTRAYSRTMAFAKVDTAPLDKLSDTMIESICNSHAAPRDRPALLRELHARLAARKQREAAQ